MHAETEKRVQVHRKRRGKRLAFTGAHLRYFAFVENGTTDELDIIVPLTEHAPRHLAHNRKRLGEEVVKCRAVLEPLAKLRRLAAKRFCGKRLQSRFMRVNFLDEGLVCPPCFLARVPRKEAFEYHNRAINIS